MKKFKPIIIDGHNADRITALEIALNNEHEKMIIVEPPEPEKILTEELKASLMVAPILNSISLSLSQDYSKKVNYSCIKKRCKRKKRKKTHGKNK